MREREEEETRAVDECSGRERRKRRGRRRGVEWKRKSVWSVQEKEEEEEKDRVRWAVDEGEERDLNNYRFEGVAGRFARNQERTEAASVSDY